MGRHSTPRHAADAAPGTQPAGAPRNSTTARIEDQFRALLGGAPDAMIIVDADGTMMIANRQAELMFGYSADELLGQPVELLLPESIRARHTHHRAHYVDEPHTRPMGSGLALIARRHDGTTFPVEVSLSSLRTEDGILITSVIRDITERKRAAEELERQVQQRTAHLNALLQVSQELFGARSLDAVLQRAVSAAIALVPETQLGVIYLFDPATQRLALRASAGFSQLPSLSLPLDTVLLGAIFTEQQRLQIATQAELANLLASEGPGAQQQLLRLLELSELPTGLLGVPLRAHRQLIGVLLLIRLHGEGAVGRDAEATLEGLASMTAAAISEAQSIDTARTLSSRVADLEQQQAQMAERVNAAEAGMLQAARLAAVGQLAASIAHEINNPLYAARNCLYLMESDQTPEQVSPYLGIARDELARIAGIIERMRDFYRPPRGELSNCDLNRLVEETLTITSLNTRHTAIQVIFTPAAGLPSVVGNADQLRQVLLNLLLNAVDAMPNGGTLTVRTLAGPTVALLEIQDTGIGMPPEIREHLFEPFFTTKPTGTGLGLSISAHIVTQHHGQIEVESKPDQGSIFRVALPYQPGA